MARADINSTDSRKAWRARNPEKDFAHRQVEYMVRRMKRAGIPLPSCEIEGCTFEGATQAHHTDYSRPLDVVWLCPHHHITGHWDTQWRAERAGQPAKIYLTRTVEIEERE